MILVLGIAAGWLAGLVRSRIAGKPYQVPEFSRIWLVLAAVFPQLLAFQIPMTGGWFSDRWAAAVLVISQVILLVFIWFNRSRTGMKILGLGLILNLLVIVLNGGLMPMSPETITALHPGIQLSTLQIGSRLGSSKNILLPTANTHLPWLSDAIPLPEWFPSRWALSLGDIVIVLGVFWLLAVESPNRSSFPDEAAE